MEIPPLEAGTKWFDKLTILSKVEGPIGFSKGRSGSSPLWSHTGIQTPCAIYLDSWL